MELNLRSAAKNTKGVILLITGVLFLIGSFFSSCYYDNKEELFGNVTCDTVNATYIVDILPILQLECYSCHDDEHAVIKGQNNFLEGHANLLDNNYVVPGDAENSLIYQAIAWIPGTTFMPYPPGSTQLSACEVALFKSWIENGAQNN